MNEFSQYGLSKEIISALSILGYDKPTKIQSMVIPEIMKDKDIVGKSQTGSGKTAAFAIPLCEKIVWDENKPQVLVLEPTRELTVQVKQEIFNIGRNKRIKVPDVFGGFPIDKQIQTLKQKSHIVVGTPGRLLDHIRRETIKLSMINAVVIDEADLMLDMGFLEDVKKILKSIPENHCTMLFSATIGNELNNLVQDFLNSPTYVEVDEFIEEKPDIKQIMYHTCIEDKYKLFLDVLQNENPDSCMIFCGTREMVNVLCRRLRKDGVKCSMIHGEIDQQDRIRTIEGFREGRTRYLIATDVVSRGIDFDNLSHVFNYDFPTGKESYVHRIGRTGRNGKSGISISLITDDDMKMKAMVEEYTGDKLNISDKIYINENNVKKFWKRQSEKPILKKKKGAEFDKTITKLVIGGGKKSKIRVGEIVGTICSIEGIEGDDVGTIDVRDSFTHVEIFNGKGNTVFEKLKTMTIKGKVRKIKKLSK